MQLYKIEPVDPYDISTDDYSVPEDAGSPSPSLPPSPRITRSRSDKNNKPSSTPKRKGKLDIEIKGRRKPKFKRKYKCPFTGCAETRYSRSDLNDHYKATHPAVRCNSCDIRFLTPSTLERHSYYHILPSCNFLASMQAAVDCFHSPVIEIGMPWCTGQAVTGCACTQNVARDSLQKGN